MASERPTIEAAPATLSVMEGDVVKETRADEAIYLYHAGETVPFSEHERKKVLLKIDMRILPMMCMLYGLNYADKTAMSWAVLFGFRKDLNLHGNEYSWASSMFYFGYLFDQYPANYLLQRFRTSRVLSFSALAWSVLMLSHLGIRNFTGLMTLRFLLGVSESFVNPGFVLYTSQWYTRKEQVSHTMFCYGLGHIHNTALQEWMYIFLVLGILSAVCGIYWLWMPEAPNKAHFLSNEERVVAVHRVAENMMGVKSYEWQSYQMLHALKDPKT